MKDYSYWFIDRQGVLSCIACRVTLPVCFQRFWAKPDLGDEWGPKIRNGFFSVFKMAAVSRSDYGNFVILPKTYLGKSCLRLPE